MNNNIKTWVERYFVKYHFNVLTMYAAVWFINGFCFVFLGTFLVTTWLINLYTPENNFLYYVGAIVHMLGALLFLKIGAWFYGLKVTELKRRGELA